MSKPALEAVNVYSYEYSNEYYCVGRADVTAIEWGLTNGHMAHLDTVKVFKNGKLYSEHPFSNVLSVYYADEEGTPA